MRDKKSDKSFGKPAVGSNRMKQYFLVDSSSHFALREAYKSARTNLLSVLSVFEDMPKQICFTSPEIADGKTLNCANIARSFAEMGAKVLVIDADMRKPKIHRIFKTPVTPGLSDYLGNFCDLDAAIHPYTLTEGLYVMGSGKLPPNPSELILSPKFNHLLNQLEERFDYVFIDAPPVCIVTDAAIIAKKTLGAVLVCRSGYTMIDVAKKAKYEVEKGGGKVLCSLLNALDVSKLHNSPKSYRYRYYGDGYSDPMSEEFLATEQTGS